MDQSYDPSFEPATAERVARNDAIFRDANERIRVAAELYADDGQPVPFMCECADPGCRELVSVTLDDYRSVRAHASRFLNAPGHDSGDQGRAEVVARNDGHETVEKTGRAREIAEELADGGGELVPSQDRG